MKKRGRPPKYPWRTMEVGDTFIAVNDTTAENAYTRLKSFRNACYAYSKKLGKTFNVIETMESIAGIGVKNQAHVVRIK